MTVKFDKTALGGKFKILNATNGGPWHKRHAHDLVRSNYESYKAAKFTYTRNHDSGNQPIYGGPYSHDISKIFRNPDADANDPDAYDFACTDEAILCALEAGAETFFRLGETIEHQIKKHATLPPRDFNKWVDICEHIILHYNYGWANGYTLGIKYWEIWNEPDLDGDDSKNKRTWGGTKAQFFELFELAAKRLKSRFPELSIGGPAGAGNMDWTDEFLGEMARRDVPLDFFSWHIYVTEPGQVVERIRTVRSLLDRHGYQNAESILNEWNYVRGWTADYIYSIKAIHGMKGAAFVMACISEAAAEPVDMMMYYGTRPSVFCGTFDYYTYERLKGYYPFYWYGGFYEEGMREVRADGRQEDVYTLCGVKDGRARVIVTHYSENDDKPPVDVRIDLGDTGRYEVYYLDDEHDPERSELTRDLSFRMKVNTSILIQEID